MWGDTREIALARSRRALAEFEIGGVRTNIPFHRGIIDNEAFLDARGQHEPAGSRGAGRLRAKLANLSLETMTTDTQPTVALPLEAAEIMRILPHRYPFLLVDRVIELEPGSGRSR